MSFTWSSEKLPPHPQTFPENQTARLTYEETAEHRSWNPHSVPGHHAEQPRGGQKKKSIFDEHDLEKDGQKADEAQRRNFLGSSHMKSISLTVWDFAGSLQHHSPVYTSFLCYICPLTTDNEKSLLSCVQREVYFFYFLPPKFGLSVMNGPETHTHTR